MTFDDFFSKLWFSYPQDLAQGKKGVKHKAMIACKKLKPEQYESILDNMEALKRYDRNDPKPDRWPHVSTFINQAYYDRDINHTEQRERIEKQYCECGKESLGEKYGRCAECTAIISDRYKEKRGQTLSKLGLMKSPEESMLEWQMRCKAYLVENKNLTYIKTLETS